MQVQQPPRPGVTGAMFDTTERWTHLAIGLMLFAQQQSDDCYDAVVESAPIDLRDARLRSAPLAHGSHRRPVPGKRARKRSGRATRPRGGVRRARIDGVIGLLPGAALGLGLAAQRQLFDRVSAVEGHAQGAVGWMTNRGPVAAVSRRLQDFLAHWDARYRAQTDAHEQLAADYLARIGPGALDALLARIDMTALLDRVDVNEAVERVDLEALVDKLPVERVIERVDLRAVVLETVAQVQVTDILRESTGAMASRLTGGRFGKSVE